MWFACHMTLHGNRHRRTPFKDWFRANRAGIIAVTVVLLGAPALSVAAIAAASPDGTVQCDPGQPLVVQPGGTWICQGAPAPSGSPTASGSPSTSPSGSPSPSPSTGSPSPTPTSPSPTSSPTPTKSPSPSPTVTGGNNCLANLAGCGFPNAANTGPTGTLTVVNGNVTITAAGSTYADREIRGCLEVRAANVTVRNVKVVGLCTTGNVRTYAAGTQFLDMEVDCRDGSNSHGFNNGTGGSATIRRADIHDCENGLNVPGNTDIQDSWIHNLYDGGSAHTDGAQFNQGASNITFRHNTIDARGNTTSAIIMWDEGNPQNSNVLIDGNLMAGGSYTLYCARQGPVTNVVITNNRFGPFTYGSSNGCWGNHVTQFSGNVQDATGAPYTE